MHLPTRYKITGAKLLYRVICSWRSLRNRPQQAEFVKRGIRWHLDLREGIDFAIFLLGGFENSLTDFYSPKIKPGDVVLDIGANIGAHTLPLARLVGSCGRVIAVEATEYAIQKLSVNLQLNPGLAAPVKVIHAVLLESTAATPQFQITSSWPLTGKASDERLEGGDLKQIGNAEHTTLDHIVTRERLTKLDWIKIDVDGNETTVLRGGITALTRFHPNILIEFAPYCNTPGSFEQLIELLTELGYEFFRIPSCKQLPSEAGALNKLIKGRGSINVFARSPLTAP